MKALPIAAALGGLAYKGGADAALRTVMAGLSPPPYRAAPRYRMSLIIPTLNEQKYLGGLLRSAHSQCEPLADIVVADCSDPGEGTAELARSWGATVVTVPRGNISQSRNMGAAQATGDVLIFSDGDMVWSNHFTERAIDALEAGAVLAHPRMTLYDSTFWHLAMFLPQLLRSPAQCGGCIAMRTEDFWSIGGYSEACNMIEDGKCFEVREIAERVAQAYGWEAVKVLPMLIGASARRYNRFGFSGGGSNFATPVRSYLDLTAEPHDLPQG